MVKKKKKLQLFVWPYFNPDWYSGLAFAIATTEAEAKRLVIKYGEYTANVTWGSMLVFPLNRRRAYAVSGGG